MIQYEREDCVDVRGLYEWEEQVCSMECMEEKRAGNVGRIRIIIMHSVTSPSTQGE